MSSLRGLLKLEDKLEAEGRRLAHLGGPAIGHLLPLIVVGTLALHVLVLLLPTFSTPAALPAESTPQDFPMVWRPGPPVAEDGSAPAAVGGERPSPAPVEPAREPSANFEPVPEPTPPIAITVSPEVDTLIPPPDTVPPSVEPASPQAGQQPVAGLTLVKRVPPVYPPGARALKIEARVTVQLVIAADGAVADASVIGSTRIGLGFEVAAIDAVKQWRYERRDGSAVPRTLVVAVDFKGAR